MNGSYTTDRVSHSTFPLISTTVKWDPFFMCVCLCACPKAFYDLYWVGESSLVGKLWFKIIQKPWKLWSTPLYTHRLQACTNFPVHSGKLDQHCVQQESLFIKLLQHKMSFHVSKFSHYNLSPFGFHHSINETDFSFTSLNTDETAKISKKEGRIVLLEGFVRKYNHTTSLRI